MKLTQFFPFLLLLWDPEPDNGKDSSPGMISQVPCRGIFPWPGHGALILLSMGYSSILMFMPLPLPASRTQKVLSCRASPQPVLHSPSSICIAEPQDSALFSLQILDISVIQMAALPTSAWSAFPPPHCPATSVLLTADLLGACAISLPRSVTDINLIDPGIDLRYLQ